MCPKMFQGVEWAMHGDVVDHAVVGYVKMGWGGSRRVGGVLGFGRVGVG